LKLCHVALILFCNGEALASQSRAYVGWKPVRVGLPFELTAKLIKSCIILQYKS